MERRYQLREAAHLDEIRRLNSINADYRATITLLQERVDELVQEEESRRLAAFQAVTAMADSDEATDVS